MKRFIDVVATVRADQQSVRQILRDSPTEVFGAVEHDERGLAPHVFRARMTVVLGTGATIEHEVLIDVGRVPGDELPLVVDLHVRPVDHAAMLPTFDGDLEVTRSADESTSLTLRGTYTAPLGPVGVVGDSLLGHRVVRSSMQLLVERLAARLQAIDGQSREQAARRTMRPGRTTDAGSN